MCEFVGLMREEKESKKVEVSFPQWYFFLLERPSNCCSELERIVGRCYVFFLYSCRCFHLCDPRSGCRRVVCLQSVRQAVSERVSQSFSQSVYGCTQMPQNKLRQSSTLGFLVSELLMMTTRLTSRRNSTAEPKPTETGQGPRVLHLFALLLRRIRRM